MISLICAGRQGNDMHYTFAKYSSACHSLGQVIFFFLNANIMNAIS